MSAREHFFMLQNCASACVNNRTYRTLQDTCDEGAPCSSGQGSEALIGSLHIQALPTIRQKTRTCCCTCSCYKILCCNTPSDKNFLRKRACVRPRFKEHCAEDRRPHPVSCVCSLWGSLLLASCEVLDSHFLPSVVAVALDVVLTTAVSFTLAACGWRTPTATDISISNL